MNPIDIPESHYRVMVHLVNEYMPDVTFTVSDISSKFLIDGMSENLLNGMCDSGMLHKNISARLSVDTAYNPSDCVMFVHNPSVYSMDIIKANWVIDHLECIMFMIGMK